MPSGTPRAAGIPAASIATVATEAVISSEPWPKFSVRVVQKVSDSPMAMSA
ncbi:hypothetical protein D3C72_2425150 [compost metagenome]